MARDRRRRPAQDESFARFLAGFKHTERRHGSEWTVQPVPQGRSEKPYICPGCGRQIPVGDAHVVAWRADGVLGDAADLAARRHWHNGCWKVS